MTDRPTTAQEDSSAMSADEQIAVFIDYLRMNNVAIVSEEVILDSVQSADRTVQVQDDRSEEMRLHAHFCASLIQRGLREVRNDTNRSFHLNLLWAAFDFGMILSPDRPPKEIERIRAEARSLMASALGKRSGEVRRENRPWAQHAEELALEAYSNDPARSNEKIADYISDSWKLADVRCPGHRWLAEFAAELRLIGRLPRRARSLRN
jgi:hypothetical protein